MKAREITKKSLDELAQTMFIISEQDLMWFIGGYDEMIAGGGVLLI